MNDVIPEDIKQFLLKYIDSVAQWECLLMVKSDTSIQWNAETIAKNLYLTETEAGRILTQLAIQGFIALQNHDGPYFRYQPKSVELATMSDRAAEYYKRYLIPITQLIHSKPKTRIQQFADAFRIRKD